MVTKRSITIGSRGSRLALKQTEIVRRHLQVVHPNLRFKIKVIRTHGDLDQSLSIFEQNKIGIFTKEIEKRLLQKKIDLAVHSLKDLPTKLPAGLAIGSYLKRDDPRDVLMSRNGGRISDLVRFASVGTSSLRRQKQLLSHRRDLRITPLRGNVLTRVRRVIKGELDAIVVAKAGLDRLGLNNGFSRLLPIRQMTPCVGQGILATEIRTRDSFIRSIVRPLNDKRAEREAIAERSLLHTLRGGCRVPIGALAQQHKKRLRLQAVVCSVKGSKIIQATLDGPQHKAEELGILLAKKLLHQGAKVLLNETRGR